MSLSNSKAGKAKYNQYSDVTKKTPKEATTRKMDE
jgi:hypothetical protein